MKKIIKNAVVCSRILLHQGALLMCGGLWSVVLLACSRGQFTHEAAQKAAVKYYTMLINGNYEAFVDGYAYNKDMPENYRSQMIDLVKQFMAEGNMPNLRSVEALNDSLCEDSTACVMLQLEYADSTFEQIELPLVLKEDGWKMK